MLNVPAGKVEVVCFPYLLTYNLSNNTKLFKILEGTIGKLLLSYFKQILINLKNSN